MSQRTMAALLAVPLLLGLFVVVGDPAAALRHLQPRPDASTSSPRATARRSSGLRARGLPRRRGAPADHDLRRPAAGAGDPRPPHARLARPDRGGLPYDSAVYAPDETDESNDTESAVQMVSSQDAAVATALTELGYDVQPVVEVLTSQDDYPAAGKLRVRDVLQRDRRHRDRDSPGRRRRRRRGPGRQAAGLHRAPQGRAGGPPGHAGGLRRRQADRHHPGPGLHLPLRGQRRHRRRHRRTQRRPDVLAGHLRHPHAGLAHRR